MGGAAGVLAAAWGGGGALLLFFLLTLLANDTIEPELTVERFDFSKLCCGPDGEAIGVEVVGGRGDGDCLIMGNNYVEKHEGSSFRDNRYLSMDSSTIDWGRVWAWGPWSEAITLPLGASGAFRLFLRKPPRPFKALGIDGMLSDETTLWFKCAGDTDLSPPEPLLTLLSPAL